MRARTPRLFPDGAGQLSAFVTGKSARVRRVAQQVRLRGPPTESVCQRDPFPPGERRNTRTCVCTRRENPDDLEAVSRAFCTAEVRAGEKDPRERICSGQDAARGQTEASPGSPEQGRHEGRPSAYSRQPRSLVNIGERRHSLLGIRGKALVLITSER
ncbi:hypothetical protein K0M31_013404, partial [Melipona bicolor]